MPMELSSWQSLDLKTQKEEYDKQALAYQALKYIADWARVYANMARALADAFGEEQVLDILEETWWNLQYEGGLTFRDEFEKDVQGAMASMARLWHEGEYRHFGEGLYDDPELEPSRWGLICKHCYHELFNEMGERKIGISWCMSDLAAVRGWSPRMVMEFPNVLLRGDGFCYQIRNIVEEADPALDYWSKEISEKCGWRSIKKLEDGQP